MLTATGLLAAGNSAKAQVQAIQAPAGQAYTIISNVPATAITDVAYQWYRNGNPILGATKENYTVPAAQAYGDNVAFYRMATAQECAGVAEKSSNTVTITFVGYVIPVGCNLIIGGVCWADAHIDNLQQFAARADMYSKFYQWNRLTAYSADDPISPNWNATADNSETWTVNPCPNGWRLPTPDEYQLLHKAGSTWANANTGRGNVVNGRFYGYNHPSCQLPNNMDGCVFFPAAGYRTTTSDIISKDSNGLSWSSMQVSNSNGTCLNFDGSNSYPASSYNKMDGMSVRCVR